MIAYSWRFFFFIAIFANIFQNDFLHFCSQFGRSIWSRRIRHIFFFDNFWNGGVVFFFVGNFSSFVHRLMKKLNRDNDNLGCNARFYQRYSLYSLCYDGAIILWTRRAERDGNELIYENNDWWSGEELWKRDKFHLLAILGLVPHFFLLAFLALSWTFSVSFRIKPPFCIKTLLGYKIPF